MKFPLKKLERKDIFFFLGVFIVGFTLYAKTLAPGLLYGDSAEFQTLAYTLGMTHPTGYPVYLLLAKSFVTVIPIGEIAYRTNLFSAVCAALALALTYLIGHLLTGWRLVSLVGVLILGSIDIFWIHAIIAELYAPAAVLVAAIFLLLLLWHQQNQQRYLFIAGLLGGLSLGIHNIVALMAPAVIIYILISSRERCHWQAAIRGALIGLFVTLGSFLLLDAYASPSSYYNSVANPSLSVWELERSQFDSPFERLSFLFMARQFRGFMFSQPFVQTGEKFTDYFDRWHWIEALVFSIGLISIFIRRWREALLLGLSWLTMMIFVTNYAVGDYVVFFIPTYIPLVLIGIIGLATIADGATWLVKRTSLKTNPYLIGTLASALIAIPIILPKIQIWKDSISLGYPIGLESIGDYPYPFEDPTSVHDQALLVVNQVEDNAIVFTDWDMLYAYYYVAHVEQGRFELSFHEIYPQPGVEELAESAVQFVDKNIDTHPVYTTHEPEAFRPYFSVSRAGSWSLFYRVERKP